MRTGRREPALASISKDPVRIGCPCIKIRKEGERKRAKWQYNTNEVGSDKYHFHEQFDRKISFPVPFKRKKGKEMSEGGGRGALERRASSR